MYLKSISLRGFKSFAEKVELTFAPGLTVIVGPNGSGKSNIVDAMTWVLGEQRLKMLRGSKMEDIIFYGSNHKRSFGICDVTLMFDNEDSFFNIFASEVSIKRRLYRSGISEYYVNSDKARMSDVLELFYASGLSKDLHNIITQGQIENIVSYKPLDRRQFLEDSLGFASHKKRKEKALKRLDDVEVNIERILSVSNEVKRRLKPLEEQIKLLKRKNELIDERGILMQAQKLVQLHHLQGTLQEKREELAQQHRQEHDFAERMRLLEKKLADLKARISPNFTFRKEVLGQQIKGYINSYELYLTILKGRQNILVMNEKSVLRNQNLLRELGADLSGLREELRVANSNLDGANAHLGELRNSRRELDLLLSSNMEKESAFESQLEIKKKQANRHLSDIRQLIAKLDDMGGLNHSNFESISVAGRILYMLKEYLNNLEEADKSSQLHLNLKLKSASIRDELHDVDSKILIATYEQKSASNLLEEKARSIEEVEAKISQINEARLKVMLAAIRKSMDDIRVLSGLIEKHLNHARIISVHTSGEEQVNDKEIIRKMAEYEPELSKLNASLSEIRIEIGKKEYQAVQMEENIASLRRSFDLSADDSERVRDKADGLSMNLDLINQELEKVERSIFSLGNVNEMAYLDYEDVLNRSNFFDLQLEDLRNGRKAVLKISRMLDEYISVEFTKKFESINENFKNIVEMLFPNCTGWLELNEDGGVDIAFLSSRKTIKKLSLLSGGERALLSIAFMFSIYKTMPSPFYIFDEVDAALDDVNLSRFIRLLSDFSQDKQVILITHQKQTMEASDVIYGVSMQPNGTTKIISERVREIALS